MEERATARSGALLADGASRVLAWQRALGSASSATLLFSSFSPPPTDEELSALERLFGDREAAIRSGMIIEGKRFEVRFVFLSLFFLAHQNPKWRPKEKTPLLTV